MAYVRDRPARPVSTHSPGRLNRRLSRDEPGPTAEAVSFGTPTLAPVNLGTPEASSVQAARAVVSAQLNAWVGSYYSHVVAPDGVVRDDGAVEFQVHAGTELVGAAVYGVDGRVTYFWREELEELTAQNPPPTDPDELEAYLAWVEQTTGLSQATLGALYAEAADERHALYAAALEETVGQGSFEMGYGAYFAGLAERGLTANDAVEYLRSQGVSEEAIAAGLREAFVGPLREDFDAYVDTTALAMGTAVTGHDPTQDDQLTLAERLRTGGLLLNEAVNALVGQEGVLTASLSDVNEALDPVRSTLTTLETTSSPDELLELLGQFPSLATTAESQVTGSIEHLYAQRGLLLATGVVGVFGLAPAVVAAAGALAIPAAGGATASGAAGAGGAAKVVGLLGGLALLTSACNADDAPQTVVGSTATPVPPELAPLQALVATFNPTVTQPPLEAFAQDRRLYEQAYGALMALQNVPPEQLFMAQQWVTQLEQSLATKWVQGGYVDLTISLGMMYPKSVQPALPNAMAGDDELTIAERIRLVDGQHFLQMLLSYPQSTGLPNDVSATFTPEELWTSVIAARADVDADNTTLSELDRTESMKVITAYAIRLQAQGVFPAWATPEQIAAALDLATPEAAAASLLLRDMDHYMKAYVGVDRFPAVMDLVAIDTMTVASHGYAALKTAYQDPENQWLRDASPAGTVEFFAGPNTSPPSPEEVEAAMRGIRDAAASHGYPFSPMWGFAAFTP